MLRSSKQVFRKKSAFYIRHLHNNVTMLLIPKVQNKASNLVVDSVFLLYQFLNVSHFCLSMKLKFESSKAP